jgi:hypothetical protein
LSFFHLSCFPKAIRASTLPTCLTLFKNELRNCGGPQLFENPMRLMLRKQPQVRLAKGSVETNQGRIAKSFRGLSQKP